MEELDELKKLSLKLNLTNHLLTQINFNQQTISTANYQNRTFDSVFNIGAIIISLIGAVYSVNENQLMPLIYAVLIAMIVLFVYNLFKLFKAYGRIKKAYAAIYEETKKLAKINTDIDAGKEVRISYNAEDFIKKL